MMDHDEWIKLMKKAKGNWEHVPSTFPSHWRHFLDIGGSRYLFVWIDDEGTAKAGFSLDTESQWECKFATHKEAKAALLPRLGIPATTKGTLTNPCGEISLGLSESTNIE